MRNSGQVNGQRPEIGGQLCVLVCSSWYPTLNAKCAFRMGHPAVREGSTPSATTRGSRFGHFGFPGLKIETGGIHSYMPHELRRSRRVCKCLKRKSEAIGKSLGATFSSSLPRHLRNRANPPTIMIEKIAGKVCLPRCRRKKFIPITLQCACFVPAETILKQGRPTRATFTWKFARCATRSLQASSGWWIRRDA